MDGGKLLRLLIEPRRIEVPPSPGLVEGLLPVTPSSKDSCPSHPLFKPLADLSRLPAASAYSGEWSLEPPIPTAPWVTLADQVRLPTAVRRHRTNGASPPPCRSLRLC